MPTAVMLTMSASVHVASACRSIRRLVHMCQGLPEVDTTTFVPLCCDVKHSKPLPRVCPPPRMPKRNKRIKKMKDITSMTAPVEHEGTVGLASWRSLRAAPSDVFPAPVDETCMGIPRVRLPDSPPSLEEEAPEAPATSVTALPLGSAKAAPLASNVASPWLGTAPVRSAPSSRKRRRRALMDVRYVRRSLFTAVSWRVRSEISRRCSFLALPNRIARYAARSPPFACGTASLNADDADDVCVSMPPPKTTAMRRHLDIMTVALRSRRFGTLIDAETGGCLFLPILCYQ